MLTYDQMLAGKVDKDACVEAYRALVRKPKNTDLVAEAVIVSMPILSCVIWSQFSWLRPGVDIYEDVLSRCACELTTFLMGDRFYERFYDEPEKHFSFIFGFFRNKILDTLEAATASHSRLNKVVSCAADAPPVQHHVLAASSAASDFRIFVSQLPTAIVRGVGDRCRFRGPERELCTLIARCMVEGRGVPTAIVRQKWAEQRRLLPFFTNYTRVLVRQTLLALRKEALSMTSVYEANLENTALGLGDIGTFGPIMGEGTTKTDCVGVLKPQGRVRSHHPLDTAEDRGLGSLC